MPTPALDPALLEEAARLVRIEGLTQRAAARQTGIGQGSLSKYLSEPDRHPGNTVSDDYEEIPVIYRDYSHLERLKVYPLGDVHIGAQAHDRRKWKSWVKWLADHEDTSMIGTGDFLNCALKDSKSEAYDETGHLGKLKRSLRDDLEPLADRVDVLIPGNHEERVYRAIGDCPINDVADFIGAPYAKAAAVLVYKVGQVSYTLHLVHGFGGGTIGACVNQLQKRSQAIKADVYVSGHTHKQVTFPDEYHDIDVKGRKVVRRARYYVSSGSFLRLEDYAARRSYSPARLGAPRITFDGGAWDVRVSV